MARACRILGADLMRYMFIATSTLSCTPLVRPDIFLPIFAHSPAPPPHSHRVYSSLSAPYFTTLVGARTLAAALAEDQICARGCTTKLRAAPRARFLILGGEADCSRCVPRGICAHRNRRRHGYGAVLRSSRASTKREDVPGTPRGLSVVHA